jgi:hypothetical protein
VGQETAAGWRAALAVASAGYAAAPMRSPGPSDPERVGPYRVEAVLGQGGMGRVFLASDERPEAYGPVALKVLTRTGDATAWIRFRRELAAARRVTGGGTARVLDGDPDADPPWLATEYINGPTLDQLVAARGPLGAQAAAALAVGVAGALAEIHAAGVVHRDLKPANIILAPDGPRVVDFGIARTTDATTLSVTGWTMGTPGYMAPEQIADPRGIGAAVDVFALGAVLVFATTGLSPYAGGDPASVIYRIVHGEPQIDGVPGELRALVAGCLARDPSARPRVQAVAAAGLRLVDEIGRDPSPEEETLAPSGAAEPTMRTALPAPDRPAGTTGNRAARATADRMPIRRARRGALGLLVLLVLGAVGVSSWFAAGALGHPTDGASTAGVGTHTAAAGRTGKGSGTKAAGGGQHTTGTAFGGGTVLAGPGCTGSPWAVFFVTPVGSLETGVGGGDPACADAADAFLKSGSTTADGLAYAQWTFTFKRAVTCTLKVYIANTDPSSGSAVYKITAAGSTRRFVLDQVDHRGGFVGATDLTGVSAPDGAIRLDLTDASPTAGDKHHVTASTVSANCTLG